jgi:hypothetical protein
MRRLVGWRSCRSLSSAGTLDSCCFNVLKSFFKKWAGSEAFLGSRSSKWTSFLSSSDASLSLLVLNVLEELRQEGNVGSKHFNREVQVGKGMLVGSSGHESNQVLGRSVQDGHARRRLGQSRKRLDPLDQGHSLARLVGSADALKHGMNVQQVVDAGSLNLRPNDLGNSGVGQSKRSSRRHGHSVRRRRKQRHRIQRHGIRNVLLLHVLLLDDRAGLGQSSVMIAKLLSDNGNVVLARQSRGLGNGGAHGQNDLCTNLSSAMARAKALSNDRHHLLATSASAVGNGVTSSLLIRVVNALLLRVVVVVAVAIALTNRRRSHENRIESCRNRERLGHSGRRIKRRQLSGRFGLVVLVDMLVAIAILGQIDLTSALGSGLCETAAR